MIHISDIIKRLSYDALVKERIIPDLLEKLDTSTKRYPPFVYSVKNDNKYAFFGMLIDYILRAAIRINIRQPIDLGIDINIDKLQNIDKEIVDIYQTSININAIAKSALSIVSAIYDQDLYNNDDIQKFVPTLVNIIKSLVTSWKTNECKLTGMISFNKNYSYEKIIGHPDIVTDTCVLDIKTTGSFSKIARQSYLQILAYYALMKNKISNVSNVGFILPMQREILIYDLSDWDYTRYLNILNIEADKINGKDKLLMVQMANCNDILMIQGLDVNNLSDYHDLIQQSIFPIKKYKIGSSTYIDKNIPYRITLPQLPIIGSQCYMCIPNAINLCNMQYDCLFENIQLAVKLKGKGFILPTGTYENLSEDIALTNMESIIGQALQFTTDECPLLLETPCGEGTEICSSIEDLGNFCYRFNNQELKKLGLCLNIAHVFIAGYDPFVYIEHWIKYCPIPIKLVYIADSMVELGSCIKKLTAPGQGYIGMETTHNIAEYFNKQNIPMILAKYDLVI